MRKIVLSMAVACAFSSLALAGEHVEGADAASIYDQMDVAATPTYDADSGAITGYTKDDGSWVCWMSVRQTAFQCDSLQN